MERAGINWNQLGKCWKRAGTSWNSVHSGGLRRTAAERSGMQWNAVALLCYMYVGVVTLFCCSVDFLRRVFRKKFGFAGSDESRNSGPVLSMSV